MLDAMGQISFLGIGISVFVGFIFGGVWFGFLVAKRYNLALGRENLPAEKPAPLFILGPLVCSLASVLTSAVLLKMLNIQSIPEALGFGLLIGIGYIMATCMNIAINPNFPRPFLYALINAPYFIINSLITCAILVSVG